MTSSRQIAANRANATKSTGPKTANGKRKSSQNAQKHGLAAHPAVSEVTRYLRIILNEDACDFAPDTVDVTEMAALRLAAAEAQVARAKAYDMLAEQEASEPPPKIEGELLMQVSLELISAVVHGGVSREEMEVQLAFYKFIHDVRASREKETRCRRRTAARYINETEAARHKALIAWTTLLETPITETKPIST